MGGNKWGGRGRGCDVHQLNERRRWRDDALRRERHTRRKTVSRDIIRNAVDARECERNKSTRKPWCVRRETPRCGCGVGQGCPATSDTTVNSAAGNVYSLAPKDFECGTQRVCDCADSARAARPCVWNAQCERAVREGHHDESLEDPWWKRRGGGGGVKNTVGPPSGRVN